MALSERQQRELDYHRDHASEHADLLSKPFSFDVLEGTRWWNAYWEMFRFLRTQQVTGKRALVVGCGFGEDAVRVAKLGFTVDAFDLSPESLRIATKLAQREGVSVTFVEAPAETLPYPDGTFDFVVARDILHHVDIPETVAELRRVSKNESVWVINEIYSHSITDKIRRSWLVERVFYPALQRFIYRGNKPYITEDERKLTETDLQQIVAPIDTLRSERYFNFVVTRLLPDAWPAVGKADQVLLRVLRPVARFLGGRVLITGVVRKH